MFVTLLVMFILCSAGDVTITLYGLRHGASEGNPVGSWLIRRYGTVSLGVVKALYVAAVLPFALVLYPAFPVFTLVMMAIAAVMPAAAIINNVLWLRFANRGQA